MNIMPEEKKDEKKGEEGTKPEKECDCPACKQRREVIEAGVDLDAMKLAAKTLINEAKKVEDRVTRGNLVLTYMTKIILKSFDTNLDIFGIIKVLELELIEAERREKMMQQIGFAMKSGKLTPISSTKELEARTEPMSEEAAAMYDRRTGNNGNK